MGFGFWGSGEGQGGRDVASTAGPFGKWFERPADQLCHSLFFPGEAVFQLVRFMLYCLWMFVVGCVGASNV